MQAWQVVFLFIDMAKRLLQAYHAADETAEADSLAAAEAAEAAAAG